MVAVLSKTYVKIADEVWIIAALLHREWPAQADFTIEQIMVRAQEEGITRPLRPGFYVHVVQHCVANRPPNPGRYRVLFETSSGRRRLFRRGDSYNPQREAGKIAPSRADIPDQYSDLLDWYHEWSSTALDNNLKSDPLLQLRGSGKRLWADEHADDYVRRLREGWE
ncbi:MAG: hypothetical protein WCC87_21480 [Candidatus Korobacteraceae bacterium]